MMKQAMFWEQIGEGKVKCLLCPHSCELSADEIGICNVRMNRDGQLVSSEYGQTTSFYMDPIEKKPLFHFKPGTYILSIAPNGCNLRCRWCQNWEISQSQVSTQYIAPDMLVALALREGSSGIAFTYTEPMIWFEYILDVAQIGKPKGLAMVLVTNGYINPEPLEQLLPYIDAMNIDLKTMSDETYKKFIGGCLEPVLNTIRTASQKCLVEVTNLVIPTINDSERDIRAVVDFIASVNTKIPLHFSRYHPAYKLDIPSTPPEKLMQAYRIGKEKLAYVYVGNLPTANAEDTNCPYCQNLLIKRRGFSTQIAGIKNDSCTKCGAKVDVKI